MTFLIADTEEAQTTARKRTTPMRLGFALEYSLGHTTHAQNLKRALENCPDIQPTYVDLSYHDMQGAWKKLPGLRSNWSLRASTGAYLALRPQAHNLQALLFHTQVTSLLSAGLMQRVPSVVSLDATPIQYDRMGEFYGHTSGGNAQLEAFKKRLNVRAFTAAKRLVTWSQWAKDSLVSDYGMPAEKVIVIPPGIDMERWRFSREVAQGSDRLHLLFVGGDFTRKGGEVLLKAFRKLPASVNATLHLVTNSSDVVEGEPNVQVYRNVTPNSEKLMDLFRQADLFVFPTRADCLALAILEAMAAGLPVIATAVGGVPEVVVPGETGLVVPPDDVDALAGAITRLATDTELRTQMGTRAGKVARERFDATTNYLRLLDVVKSIAR